MPRYAPSYCPYCGRELDSLDFPGGYCEECDEYVFQQSVIAAEVLVIDGDRVLLQKRGAGRKPGTWGFPGGHVEPGESPWAAAVRELEDETGLRADAATPTLFDSLFDTNEDGSHYVVLGFTVPRSDTQGTVTADNAETDSLAFMGPADLPADADLFHRAYRDRVSRAVERQTSRSKAVVNDTIDLR